MPCLFRPTATPLTISFFCVFSTVNPPLFAFSRICLMRSFRSGFSLTKFLTFLRAILLAISTAALMGTLSFPLRVNISSPSPSLGTLSEEKPPIGVPSILYKSLLIGYFVSFLNSAQVLSPTPKYSLAFPDWIMSIFRHAVLGSSILSDE